MLKHFIGQLLAAVLVSLIFLIFSLPLAIAAVFGAFLMLLANSLFALRFFVHFRYDPSHVIGRFFTGALLKWVILLVGFFIAVKLGLVIWGFLAGLMAVLIGFYAVSLGGAFR